MYQLIVGHGEWASPMVKDKRVVEDWNYDKTIVTTTKNVGAWGLGQGPLCTHLEKMAKLYEGYKKLN